MHWGKNIKDISTDSTHTDNHSPTPTPGSPIGLTLNIPHKSPGKGLSAYVLSANLSVPASTLVGRKNRNRDNILTGSPRGTWVNGHGPVARLTEGAEDFSFNGKGFLRASGFWDRDNICSLR